MDKNTTVTSEAVEALDARMPFRFPREMVIVLIVFAVLWEIVSWLVPPFVIPGWERIFKSLLSLRVRLRAHHARPRGRRPADLVRSRHRTCPWRCICGRRSRIICRPVVRLFMAVPVVCWILFSVLWFKWVEFRIAFVLIVVCAPVFIIDFLDGMKGVQQELRDMLRSFRPSRVQFFTKLLLPATVPVILTSWKINLSLAIRVVTIAELVGAISGVGYGLVMAQELFSVADVFAWTLVLVVILFLAEAVLTLVEERMLRWRT